MKEYIKRDHDLYDTIKFLPSKKLEFVSYGINILLQLIHEFENVVITFPSIVTDATPNVGSLICIILSPCPIEFG